MSANHPSTETLTAQVEQHQPLLHHALTQCPRTAAPHLVTSHGDCSTATTALHARQHGESNAVLECKKGKPFT